MNEKNQILAYYVRALYRQNIGFALQEKFTGIRYSRLKDLYLGAKADREETMKWLKGMDELSLHLQEMVSSCEAELKGEIDFGFDIGD